MPVPTRTLTPATTGPIHRSEAPDTHPKMTSISAKLRKCSLRGIQEGSHERVVQKYKFDRDTLPSSKILTKPPYILDNFRHKSMDKFD